MTSKLFPGTWKLISQTTQHADGSTSYPRGEEASGILMYDAQGHMSVQLMRAGHSWGDLANFRTAMEQYLAYFGNYRVDEAAGTVTHIIEGCSFPGWIGTEQVRQFRFEGDLLRLTAQGTGFDGLPETRVIVWRRVG